MFILSVTFPVWTIDWTTYKGRGISFSVDYGPFDSEQQAKWFWLTMKEKMKRNYESVVISDTEYQYQYFLEDGSKPA
jgi:hypothetical protein